MNSSHAGFSLEVKVAAYRVQKLFSKNNDSPLSLFKGSNRLVSSLVVLLKKMIRSNDASHIFKSVVFRR